MERHAAVRRAGRARMFAPAGESSGRTEPAERDEGAQVGTLLMLPAVLRAHAPTSRPGTASMIESFADAQ